MIWIGREKLKKEQKKQMIKLIALMNLLKQAQNFFISFLSKPKYIKKILSIKEIFSGNLADAFNNLIF